MDGSTDNSQSQMAEPVPADSSKVIANQPSGAGDSAAVNHVNGVSSHKSSSSSGHKDKHHSSSDKHRSSSGNHSSSSKHKHSGSSSSKHSSSSSRDPSKHSSSSSSKHHSSSSSKHSSSHSSSKSSSHKHGSSSSSSKHHSSSSGDKKHSSSSSGDKKHHSSSSSGKHSSSSGDKKHHSSSSSKHSSSGDRKHHSSSGDKKHHSSSKHSSSSGEKKHHGASGDKKHSSSSESKPPKMEVTTESSTPAVDEPDFKVKAEPVTPIKLSIKKERYEGHMANSESEDDLPLTARMEKVKEEVRSPNARAAKRAAIVESDDDEDDVPLSARKEKSKKVKTEPSKKRKAEPMSPEPKKKTKVAANVKTETSPTKKKKKGEEKPEEKWKWWEEGPRNDGVKWRTLEHKGPVFAPDYEPLPSHVRFYYDGIEMKLAPGAEEVAGFYARMLDHDYTTKDIFNKNFFKDWRRCMNPEEKSIITDLKKCNFREMHAHFMEESEKRKNRTKEEKEALKKENAAIMEEYGWCIIDGHKQKIGNFRIEPPGLFRGRGDHPKQGMLKTRTMPEDVIINCSKGVKPPSPPAGRRWKEVRHDNTVSWLACWSENIQNSTKYVMLNAASRLKGEKDWQKYETARKLHSCADKIRAQYREDWKSKEMRIRQRAVALYFIDKLALRAGNEKDEDTADTVGCCSLRVEHINLHEELDGQNYVVEFDFLGKDSIRYYNKVQVEKRVFKNLQLFSENKQPGDDLFDRLNTAILNKHLTSLMDGLTAKVFRTFNASKTLQEQLELLTNGDDNVAAKLLSYNRANRAVAVLCNHQRAAPKNFSKQMENLQNKIEAKKDQIKDAKRELKSLKSDLKATKTVKAKNACEKKKKAIDRLEEQLIKLEVQATDKDENKEIALGTSKLNYLDPRISVAWCKKWDVPIEKVYNKTQREKFAWAIDMTDEDYTF